MGAAAVWSRCVLYCTYPRGLFSVQISEGLSLPAGRQRGVYDGAWTMVDTMASVLGLLVAGFGKVSGHWEKQDFVFASSVFRLHRAGVDDDGVLYCDASRFHR